MKNTNLKQQLEAQSKGVYLDSSGNESGCYNFYDWFCSTNALKNKAKFLYSKVRSFLKHNPHIDTERVYVFFKNNCPMSGKLYDDFRICDVETGNVIYNVTPRSSHSGKAEVWSRDNEFQAPIRLANTFSQLYKK